MTTTKKIAAGEVVQDFEKIERTEPLRVAGSFFTKVLRFEYQERGPDAALELGRQCLAGVTDEQILKIAMGKARIEGMSPCIVYVEAVEEKEGP